MIYSFEKDVLISKLTEELSEQEDLFFVGVSFSNGVTFIETSQELSASSLDNLTLLVMNHNPNDDYYLRLEIPDVTPRQFRQALIISGISMQAIEDLINSQPEPLRSLAMVEWEYSTAFVRSNQMVNQLAPAIGFTPAMLDQLWILAGTL
jgi:hypothetical protein